MHKFHPRVPLLSLKDFILQSSGPQREGKMKHLQVVPETEVLAAGRWFTVVGLSPGRGSSL